MALVILSLVFAIAIVSPEPGATSSLSSQDITTVVQTSVTLSTDTIISVITETASTTATLTRTTIVPISSTQSQFSTTFTTVTSTSSTTTSTVSTASSSSQTSTHGISSTLVTTTASTTTNTSTSTTTSTTSLSSTSATTTVSSTISSTSTTTIASGSSIAPMSTVLTFSCYPSEFELGLSTICTSAVTSSDGQYPPTGQVSFASILPATFAPTACILKSNGSCSANFTPYGPATGYYTITATYPGDSLHRGSSANVTLIVPPAGPTFITCYPYVISINATAYCTATVVNSQDFPVPTGTITFISTKAGKFDHTSCTLDSTGSCSVVYTPGAGSQGITTITAKYSGDNDHASTSGTVVLTVT
ncbi:MAG: Ig-like domain repeat protein [Thaumarchaeota archaeon]|nr:Ig-like domain repeat protein [Nitrososphaerota archaeon]